MRSVGSAPSRPSRATRLVSVLVAAALLGPSTGCYYLHLGSGQARLMLARESSRDLLEAPDTPEPLREQLALVERVRGFASGLGLEVGERYTSYVDWPGDRIVTTVVATRPGETRPRSFEFPIVGEVPYKGFFDAEAAEAEARALRDEGLDVCLVPVTAYSTLGWLDDPLTAPMLRRDDDTRLVETVLHELVHATVFVESQPDFNEGVARFIGQEAAVRFYADEADDPETAAAATARVAEDRRVAARLLAFRGEVEALYAREPDPSQRARERAALEARFREELRDLALATRDPDRLAERVRLGDACLAIGGTYAADDARHARVFEALGGDLGRVVERLRESASKDDPRAWFFGALEPAGGRAAAGARE